MEQNSGYRRLRITLPPETAQRVNEVAEEYAGGNTSELIRRAFNTYLRKIDGRDEFEFKKLRGEIETMVEKVDALEDAVEARPPSASFKRGRPPDEAGSKPTDDAAVEREVQSCLLEEGKGPLSLNALANQVDAEPLAIQGAIKSLRERDFVEKHDSDDELPRYRIKPP